MELTGIQAAKILGLTPSRISQLRKAEGLSLDPSKFGEWLRDRNAVQESELDGQREKARVDHGRANLLELQVGEKQRTLIPASEVEEVVATAFAAIASDIRAIPDNLERQHGIEPAVAEHVERALFQAMDALADRLAALGLNRDAE